MATKNQASNDATEQPRDQWLHSEQEDAPSAALQAFYASLPEDVRMVCETARITLRDAYKTFQAAYKREIVVVYTALDQLDPALKDGHTFADYCRAAGINYRTAHSIVRRELGALAPTPTAETSAPPKQEGTVQVHTAPSAEEGAATPDAAASEVEAAGTSPTPATEPSPVETRSEYGAQGIRKFVLVMPVDVADDFEKRLDAVVKANNIEDYTRAVLFLLTYYEREEEAARVRKFEEAA